MGGRISETTIREVRDRADIIEVISETVPLNRAGASFRGLCPFHREKTPSFFVNPARQAFKCFGCGEGGSVIDFMMKARNLTFADAVEELAGRCGVTVLYEGGRPHASPREDLYAIVRLASETYRGLMSAPSGKAGRDFLERRGVTPEAEREFSIGWSGHGGELLAALKKAGIEPARAQDAGLVVPSPSGQGQRARFRGRVLFPVADARGRICGFGGRAVDDAVPKYLNSPESDLYRKSTLLYGLHQALPSIRRDGRVVVVEGYMDLIGLWQKGIRSAVATCGTALTENHARTMKRLSENVILFYDGDLAGKMAAVRSGEPLYAAGVSPKVLFPPTGMDPDDWAKTVPAEELVRRIEGAEPLMEYIDRGVSRKYDLGSISGKLSYVRKMEKYLGWILDPAEKELYVQRVAQKTALPVETIHQQLGGAKKRPAPREESAVEAARASLPEESLLLQLLASDPALAREAREEGVGELLTDGDAREVLACLAALADRNPSEDASSLLTESLPAAVRKRLSAEIVRADFPAGEARKRYPAALLALRIRGKQREIESLNEMLKVKRAPEEENSLYERVVAAKKEKERLESERRSR
ncbi:MAG: DNA primase [Deltaproteobacteria bacterium]|nr:DNA primase [Deltaproteobacteria bacterium]